jgi:hypothetical protein
MKLIPILISTVNEEILLEDLSNKEERELNISKAKEKTLAVAQEEGLHKAMQHYSTFVSSAPKPRIKTSGYNTYTPQGQMTVPNTNYRKEMTVWKNTKLFPFFMENGYTKEQLTDAFNKSVFVK